MKIIGLTGSIGMGKSTTARQLRAMGYSVYDADLTIHRLMRKGGSAVEPVAKAFPGLALERNGEIDREQLRQLTYEGRITITELETVLHPLEAEYRTRWLQKKEREGRDMVFLDIPLLFEKEYDREMDAVLVVSAPAAVQKERVLARKGMTAARLKKILSHQISDSEKRARADFIIHTDKGMDGSRADLRAAIKAISSPDFVKRKVTSDEKRADQNFHNQHASHRINTPATSPATSTRDIHHRGKRQHAQPS